MRDFTRRMEALHNKPFEDRNLKICDNCIRSKIETQGDHTIRMVCELTQTFVGACQTCGKWGPDCKNGGD